MRIRIDWSKVWKGCAAYELKFSDGSIYVGATREFAVRLSAHLKRIRNRTAGIKFLQVLDSGAYLEEVTWWEFEEVDQALRMETRLIAAHILRGTHLLNSTEDGKNNSKRALMVPEAREVLSKSMTQYHAGLSPAQRSARGAYAAKIRDEQASSELRKEWGKKRHESLRSRVGDDAYHEHFSTIGKRGAVARDQKYTHEDRSAWIKRAWETRRAKQRLEKTES